MISPPRRNVLPKPYATDPSAHWPSFGRPCLRCQRLHIPLPFMINGGCATRAQPSNCQSGCCRGESKRRAAQGTRGHRAIENRDNLMRSGVSQVPPIGLPRASSGGISSILISGRIHPVSLNEPPACPSCARLPNRRRRLRSIRYNAALSIGVGPGFRGPMGLRRLHGMLP
jgi:hypothetical protein